MNNKFTLILTLFALSFVLFGSCRKVESEMPLLLASVDAISFTATETQKTFTIKNDINSGGSGTLTYSVSANQSWMTVAPQTGNINGSETATITITVNRAGLTSFGILTGKVAITSNGGSLELNVTMLNPKPNEAPSATFTSDNLNGGFTNTEFIFDASKTTDDYTKREVLKFSWKWDVNESFSNPAAGDTIRTHAYATAGIKKITLKVSDGEFESLYTDSVEVYGPKAPEITTISLAEGDQTHNSAKLTGNLTKIGNGATSVSAHGFYWSKTDQLLPLTNFLKVDLGSKSTTGSYTYNVTDLSASTTYFVWAFATNGAGTTFGNRISFKTTIPKAPLAVSTGAISDITQTTATAAGTINNLGVGITTIKQHGHCWSETNIKPTITDNHSSLGEASAIGNFSTTSSSVGGLSGLTPGKTHYIRAYITNSNNETFYGDPVTFNTLQ